MMTRNVRGLVALSGVAFALMLGGCVPPGELSYPTGSIDQFRPWQIPYNGSVSSNTAGSGGLVLVAGDSLIHWGGVAGDARTGTKLVADTVTWVTGHPTAVAAVAGSSYSHWVRDYLIKGPLNTGAGGADRYRTGVATIKQYEDFFKPRLTVIALGINDARIATETRDNAPVTADGKTYDTKYRIDSDFKDSLATAVSDALSRSKCVLLVTPSVRNDAKFLGNVAKVNTRLRAASAGNPARVRIADWASKDARASNAAWYVSDNVHHTDAGKKVYREFIAGEVAAAFRAGC